MAPLRTPGRKRREADYSGIGKYGRKTGVTVPDLGPRDEYGLEPVDKLFSSPHKDTSSEYSNPRDDNDNGEEMELAISSPRDTSDLVASARRRAHLPPKSRSPIRTSLGSSPRRLGADTRSLDSRARSKAGEGVKASLFSRLNRQNMSILRKSITPGNEHEDNPYLKVGSIPLTSNGNLSGSTVKTFELIADDETSEKVDDSISSGSILSDNAHVYEEVENVPMLEDTGIDAAASTTESDLENGEIDHRSLDQGSILNRDDSAEEHHITSSPGVSKRKKGEYSTTGDNRLNQIKKHQEKMPASASSTRWKKNEKRITRDRVANQAGRAPSDAKKRKPSSGSLKPNPSSAQLPNSASVSRSSERAKQGEWSSTAMAPVVLRSGRTSVKPLAYWRGEQILYEPPTKVGKSLLPGGYRGVDPGRETDELSLRPLKKRSVVRSGRMTKINDVAIDEDASAKESWEIEGDNPGVLNAGVFVWDHKLQNRIEDAHEEIVLALAPAAIDERTQWAKGRTFKFGKTLTLPFFHSGIVDLPPGGEKRPKNSRKNHMVFWVFSGRVRVDVSGNVFSVGRGGMWQVPRGNSYGLSNPFDHDARIFFAQGSYMEQPEDESTLLTGAATAE